MLRVGVCVVCVGGDLFGEGDQLVACLRQFNL